MTSADDQPLLLTLELMNRADPIAGRLSQHGGASWQFTGWVELAQAVEDACATHTPADTRGAPHGES